MLLHFRHPSRSFSPFFPSRSLSLRHRVSSSPGRRMNALPLVDASRRVFRNHRALSRAHLHTPMRARERARMCKGYSRTHARTHTHYVRTARGWEVCTLVCAHARTHTHARSCSPRSSPPSSSIIECHRQRRYFPQKAHARTQPRTHIHSVSSNPEKASVRFVPRPSRSHSARPLRLVTPRRGLSSRLRTHGRRLQLATHLARGFRG